MKLYKYYPPENCDMILTLRGDISLRFSQPSALNDPFDLSPSIKMPDIDTRGRVEEIIKRAGTKSKYYMDGNTGEYFSKENIEEFELSEQERMLKQKVNNLKKHNDENIGVLSLSRNHNSNLMWSHYAKNHTGFMIEIENSFDINKGYIGKSLMAKEVTYHNNRPQTKLHESYSDESYFLFKDPSWEYEKEMRLVVQLSTLKPIKNTETHTLPCYCHQYPVSKLSRIVIGALCPKEKEIFIRNWANEFAPHTLVEKAYLSATDYELKYKQSPARHTSDTPNHYPL